MIFRVLVREWFEYLGAIGSLGVKYEACPFECHNSDKIYDIDRVKFCDPCPRARERRVFERQTREAITVKLGEDEESKFDFDRFNAVLHNVRAMTDMSSKELTIKSSYLVGIYNEEKKRSLDK